MWWPGSEGAVSRLARVGERGHAQSCVCVCGGGAAQMRPTRMSVDDTLIRVESADGERPCVIETLSVDNVWAAGGRGSGRGGGACMRDGGGVRAQLRAVRPVSLPGFPYGVHIVLKGARSVAFAASTPAARAWWVERLRTLRAAAAAVPRRAPPPAVLSPAGGAAGGAMMWPASARAPPAAGGFDGDARQHGSTPTGAAPTTFTMRDVPVGAALSSRTTAAPGADAPAPPQSVPPPLPYQSAQGSAADVVSSAVWPTQRNVRVHACAHALVTHVALPFV